MKKIILIFLLLNINLSFSLPQSLGEYIKVNSNYKNEDSSKSFIASRCAVLNLFVYERSKDYGTEEFLKLAEQAEMLSEMFFNYSKILYLKSGGDEEQFMLRFSHWTKLYGDEAVENIRTYNNMMEGEFGDDVDFCNQNFSSFVMNDTLNLK